MSTDHNSPAVAFLLEQLAKQQAAVFQPVGRNTGIDLAVRARDGQYVELVCLQGTPEAPRAFKVRRFRRRPNLIMACIVVANDGALEETWLIPSGVFERFGSLEPDGGCVLDLDSDTQDPVHERLAVYRERWALITDFTRYRSTLEDPLALQVRIAMG
ncbi:MAG: hypothetical protein WD533_05875 [Dehalococcoidia bacterium]